MSFVPQVVTRNWRLKLSAFGLAVFLWAVVRAEPAGVNTFTSVPVVVDVSPLDWTLAAEPNPATVEVRFTGTPRDFRLGRPGPVVRVPIDSVASEDTVVQLARDWVVADGRPALLVQDIVPSQVRLRFERTRAALLPLSLRTENELPDGRALAQPLALTPVVVRVRGRVSRVEGLDSIPLEPLDLSAVDRSGQYRLAVDTTGLSDLTFLTEPEASVSVRLEDAVEQTFSGVPVVVSLPSGVESGTIAVQPGEVDVMLRGGRTRVAQTEPGALQAVVPEDALTGMIVGETRTVAIRVRGVPELVRAFSTLDSVRVRWLPEAAVDREGQPEGADGVEPVDGDTAVGDTTETGAGTTAGGNGGTGADADLPGTVSIRHDRPEEPRRW